MPYQILLFDQSRSASHLLRRIFGSQPHLKLLDSPLSAPRGTQVEWLGSEGWEEDGMQEDKRLTWERRVEEGVGKWRESLERMDEGGVLLVHDHPFSGAEPEVVVLETSKNPTRRKPEIAGRNFTRIPDDLLLLHPGTIPILTIRDPRLAVPSTYRVLESFGLPLHGSGRPNFLVSTATIWQRRMYDFFTANGVEVIVVDADDVMTSKTFCRALMARIGLDPGRAVFQWDPPTESEKKGLHPMFYKSQKFLIDSKEVDERRAARNMDLRDVEFEWEREFGEDFGLIKEAVDAAMPGYEWLHERRFKG